ncbi:hypothetical protein EV363DRAFT_1183485 [Boletus edulis]|nr:hypothetical protein EV363DRAFT_1183485 [Boletus edulis]
MTSAQATVSLYDSVYDSLLSMPGRLVLARSNYGTDFTRHIVANNMWDYRSLHGSEKFETILVGKVRPAICGTRFSAKGNHYIGSLFNPNYIYDKTRVKSLFVLGKPCDVPEHFGDLWDNQIATLCEIIEQDKVELEGKKIQIKEWTTCAGSDDTGFPDYIAVVTEPMYTTVAAKRPVKASGIPFKKKALGERAVTEKASTSSTQDMTRKDGTEHAMFHDFDIDDMDMQGTSVSEDGKLVANETDNANKRPMLVTTNDVYHPSILPDYGGDLFKHMGAKLRQLDFRDVDDNLIHPEEWYSELRQGTLVMVRASLQVFNWDNRHVYQLNAHTIRVLRRSQSEPEEHKQTFLNPDSFNRNVASEAASLVSKVQLGKRRAAE